MPNSGITKEVVKLPSMKVIWYNNQLGKRAVADNMSRNTETGIVWNWGNMNFRKHVRLA